MNKDHYQFTYENDPQFRPFASNYMTICHGGPFSEGNFDVPGIPPFNPMMLLHGEEEINVIKPLKADAKYFI